MPVLKLIRGSIHTRNPKFGTWRVKIENALIVTYLFPDRDGGFHPDDIFKTIILNEKLNFDKMLLHVISLDLAHDKS